MNIASIGAEIIKTYAKGDLVFYTRDIDGFIWITTDGLTAYYIHEKTLPLKYELLAKSTLFDKTPLDIRTTDEAHLTNQMFTKPGIKEIVKIKNEKTSVYVNNKLLKNFGKNVTFRISTPISPVYVCEENVIVGMVMPMRFKEVNE